MTVNSSYSVPAPGCGVSGDRVSSLGDVVVLGPEAPDAEAADRKGEVTPAEELGVEVAGGITADNLWIVHWNSKTA